MAITFTLPEELERELRKDVPDLEQKAKEAFLIARYSAGDISLGALAEGLGLPTTIVALEWLKERGIPLNYGFEDYQQDLRTLDELFNRKP